MHWYATITREYCTFADECEYLKLCGGTVLPEHPDYGLGIFRRVLSGGSTEYEAIDGSGYRVWKNHEMERWVVGI